jgi:hypothetical protein
VECRAQPEGEPAAAHPSWDQFAEANQPILAAVYYQHANAATTQAELVRRALGLHATLSVERLRPRADAGRGACRQHARA